MTFLLGLAEVWRDRRLEATCAVRGSAAAAAAKPRPRRGKRRKRVERWTLGVVREVEEEVVGMRERDVGAAAEAIV